MNIKFSRQSQFELFPGGSENSQGPGKKGPLTKDLTVSLENISVLCIIFVMVTVLFFSLGVEKGKRVSMVPKSLELETHLLTAEKVSSPQEPVVEASPEETLGVPQSVVTESPKTVEVPAEVSDEQENLFTIQVASFKLKKNAEKEAEILKGIGMADAFVVSKGSHSIVCIGKFPQMSDAKILSNKLKNRYNDCLVRRL